MVEIFKKSHSTDDIEVKEFENRPKESKNYCFYLLVLI